MNGGVFQIESALISRCIRTNLVINHWNDSLSKQWWVTTLAKLMDLVQYTLVSHLYVVVYNLTFFIDFLKDSIVLKFASIFHPSQVVSHLSMVMSIHS